VLIYKTLTELLLKRPKVRLSAASCVSGVVIKVGSRVTRCSPGDRVVGAYIFLIYLQLYVFIIEVAREDYSKANFHQAALCNTLA